MSAQEPGWGRFSVTLFEVSEEEFARCSSVRRAMLSLILIASLSIMAGVMAVWSLAAGQLRPYDAPYLVPPFVAVALIAYMEYSSLRRLNRFGIGASEIAPPLKPRRSPVREGRLVIPFSSIARVEYHEYGEGPAPAHFGVMLKTIEGTWIPVNDSMIAGQVGRHPERMRQAQRLLQELAQRFGPQPDEGRAQFGNRTAADSQ